MQHSAGQVVDRFVRCRSSRWSPRSDTSRYRALRQLGSAIENLARSNGEAQSSPATEHSVMRSLRRRLRLAPKEDLEDHDEIAVAPKNARRIEPFQVRPVAA